MAVIRLERTPLERRGRLFMAS